MAGTAHLVGRASVEVQAGGVDGFRFQGEVAEWVHGRLLPELESILDSLPALEGHVVLDRLDVVLDAGTTEDWRDRAISRLREVLAAALRRKLSDFSDGGVQRLSSSEAFLRGWTHYLEEGALPWNLALPDGAALEAGITTWLDGIDAAAPVPERAVSLARSLRTTGARQRLLALPDALVERILSLVFGIEPRATRRWVGDLERLSARLAGSSGRVAEPFPRGRRDLLDALLVSLANRPLPSREGIERSLERSVELAIRGRLEGVRGSFERLAGIDFESEAFQAVQRAMGSGPSESFPLSGKGKPIEAAGDDAATPSEYPPPEESRRKMSFLERAEDAPRTVGGVEDPIASKAAGPQAVAASGSARAMEGFHIPSAGLVLVAPYLPLLFDRLDLHLSRRDANGRIAGDHAAALTVSHYLATGRDDPSEFELVLAKVLCGMEPGDSCGGPVVLDARPREEGEELLASVLGHWGALKGTSIDGLREAFLQRPGKLTLLDGFWRLQVEQKPWDMLLEQLPWSFQFTRFPWMSRTLKTEWME